MRTAEQPAVADDIAPETAPPRRGRRVGLIVVAGLGVAIVAGAAIVLLGGDDGPGTTDDVVASGDSSGPDDGRGDSEGTADIEEDGPSGEATEGTADAEAEASSDDESVETGDAATGETEARDTEFADTYGTEWGDFETGSPEAVVATFYDAVQAGDCEQIVDLWTQDYVEQLGETRQEQVAACGEMFDFEQAPEYDPDSIRVVSETETTAVVAVTLTSQGSSTTPEMHLKLEEGEGWKIDLLGGTEQE